MPTIASMHYQSNYEALPSRTEYRLSTQQRGWTRTTLLLFEKLMRIVHHSSTALAQVVCYFCSNALTIYLDMWSKDFFSYMESGV